MAISEGKPLCSSRGTFYFGVSKTLIIDAEILPGTRLCARAKRLGLVDDKFWLTDEPCPVYDHEHSKERLDLFRTALELRKKLLSPLWLNRPRFALIRWGRPLKGVLYKAVAFLRRRDTRSRSRAQRSASRHMVNTLRQAGLRVTKNARIRCKKLLLRVVRDPYRVKECYVTANPDVDWWRSHLNSTVILEAGSLISEHIADFGCNHGACTILMARNGKRALGVDLNLKTLRIAKGLRRRENDAVQKNVDFVCARLTELPFSDQSLGGGFVIDVLEHFYQKDIPLFFSEVKRVLKPGSRLQIITPFEHAYDDGLQHVTFFDLASLTRLLNDSGMKIIKIERDRRSDVYTPQGHDRINALIEIV